MKITNKMSRQCIGKYDQVFGLKHVKDPRVWTAKKILKGPDFKNQAPFLF